MSERQVRYSERKIKRVMQSYFTHTRQARLIIALIMMLTGATGFGLSLLQLRLGVEAMALRYPAAVLGAWLTFLALIRLWVSLERRRFDPDSAEMQAAIANPATSNLPSPSSEKTSIFDWLDAPTTFDIPDIDGPGCLLATGVAIVIGLAALLVAVVSFAPILVSELFVDIVLSSLLYKRLKNAAVEHWLGTCIRRTWLYVTCAISLLGLGGWLLDHNAPNSHTVGKAVKEIYELKFQKKSKAKQAGSS